ncbi:MAG: hypothetical protein ACK50N_05785 [Flavobacteriales bacterium]|jgi:hypothetical protein
MAAKLPIVTESQLSWEMIPDVEATGQPLSLHFAILTQSQLKQSVQHVLPPSQTKTKTKKGKFSEKSSKFHFWPIKIQKKSVTV